MSDKYCPVCENTTYNCECDSSTTCDACNQSRAAGHTLSECALCRARNVTWCKWQFGGCSGCESCCKCNRRCEGCDEPFTDEHPECELDPGWHRGNPEGHCCVGSPNNSHRICQGCYKHYEALLDSNKCEDCRDEHHECAEYGHEWEIVGDELDPTSSDNIHIDVELECTECGLLEKICQDLDVEQL